MKRKIVDPEFGEVEVPEPPQREEYLAVQAKVREALKNQRLWPLGSTTKCFECGKKAVVGRNDLSSKVPRPGALLVFRNLRGGKCVACGTQYLEPADAMAVEEETGVGVVADFEAKVSKIGSGSLGTYWPKDLVRIMSLEHDEKAFIQVIDKRHALVSFEDAKE